MTDSAYRIDLDVYGGPLDLLLYLIRREEVDIWDIPVARITDEYLQYLAMLNTVNVNVAAEFIEMAATLLEIKSRMLLPREPSEGEQPLEDPRTELVQQLLEYKKYKDAARRLEQLADERSQRFGRGAHLNALPESLAEDEIRNTNWLSEVTLWDLLSALQKVLKEIRLDTPRRVVLDETPVEEHCRNLMAVLRERRSLMFSELFRTANDRSAVIGLFLALLELIRLKALKVEQSREFGEIHIVYVQEPPTHLNDSIARATAAGPAGAPPPDDAQSNPPRTDIIQ